MGKGALICQHLSMFKKKKRRLAFLRQFSVERKLKSQLLFNLQCEDSGIHWKIHLESSIWFSNVDDQVRYCADKQEELCFFSFSRTCSDIQHAYDAFYRYSFQAALFSPKSETNLKTYVSKGVYPS